MKKLNFRQKGLAVIFEGTDGVGKTTIAQQLETTLRSKFQIETTYIKGIGSKSWFGQLAIKFPSTLFFLIELLVNTLKIFGIKSLNHKIVLLDRYFFSIASHYPQVDSPFSRIFLSLSRPLFIKIFKPDIIFHLVINPKKQIKRIGFHAKNRFHQYLINHPEILAERNNRLKKLLKLSGLKIIQIDTSDELPATIVSKIIPFLGLNPSCEK